MTASTSTATLAGPRGAADEPTGRFGPGAFARVVAGSARTSVTTRVRRSGLMFYLMVWISFPLFNLFMVALIYRADPSLRSYAIVGGAGMALMFQMQFNAAEVLDGERYQGRLGNLFVAPAPRFAWLGGFQLGAVCESLATAAISVALGKAVFGLPLHVNLLALVASVVLLIVALWGFSMIVGAIGVALRDANQLSNLIFPVIQIVAGTMYPIAAAPEWVRVPARCLPFGYGIQAIADSLTQGAGFGDLASELIPLAGFAIVLPLLGILAFRAVERRSRVLGSLDLI